VLLVDDHDAFRLAARAELEDGGFEVVAELSAAACVVAAATRLRPDLVLLDIRLPDGDGIELAGQLALVLPDTQVVLISTVPADDAEEQLAAAGSGARFMSKALLSSPALRTLLTA
jgi:DNA-binding NarL/FixJ family response regulator